METTNENQPENNAEIAILSQYIKDFSFENPNAPYSLGASNDSPNVELALDLNIKRLPDDEDVFEVSLQIEASAGAEDKKLFLIELTYAGVFRLVNFPKEHQEAVLAVQCPQLIFPFARRIIADVTQDSGFQALRIDPIDFSRLYRNKLMQDNVEMKAE